MAEIALPPGCTAKVNGFTMVSEDDRYGDGTDTYSVTVDGDFTSLIKAQLKAADRTFERRTASGPPNATTAFFDTLATQAHSAGAAAQAMATRIRKDARHFQTHVTAVSGLSFAAVVLVILGLFVCRNRKAANDHRMLFGSFTTFNRSRTVCDLQKELTSLQNKVSQLQSQLKTTSHVSIDNRLAVRRLESVRPKCIVTGAQGPLVAARFTSGTSSASAPATDSSTVTLLPLTYNDPAKPSS